MRHGSSLATPGGSQGSPGWSILGPRCPKGVHFGHQNDEKINKNKSKNKLTFWNDFAPTFGCLFRRYPPKGVRVSGSHGKSLFLKLTRKWAQNVSPKHPKSILEVIQNMIEKRCQFWRGAERLIPGLPLYPVSEIGPGRRRFWRIGSLITTFQHASSLSRRKAGGYIYIYIYIYIYAYIGLY